MSLPRHEEQVALEKDRDQGEYARDDDRARFDSPAFRTPQQRRGDEQAGNLAPEKRSKRGFKQGPGVVGGGSFAGSKTENLGPDDGKQRKQNGQKKSVSQPGVATRRKSRVRTSKMPDQRGGANQQSKPASASEEEKGDDLNRHQKQRPAWPGGEDDRQRRQSGQKRGEHQQRHPEPDLLPPIALGQASAVAGSKQALQCPPTRWATRVLGQIWPARQHAVDQAAIQADRADRGEGDEEWRLRSREQRQIDERDKRSSLIGDHGKRGGEKTRDGNRHGDAGDGFQIAVARESRDARCGHDGDATTKEESVHHHVKAPHRAASANGPHPSNDIPQRKLARERQHPHGEQPHQQDDRGNECLRFSSGHRCPLK